MGLKRMCPYCGHTVGEMASKKQKCPNFRRHLAACKKNPDNQQEPPMTTESIPEDCLPAPEVIDAVMTPPSLDHDGRIRSGTYAGMTPAEVAADRDAYNAACEGGGSWMREIAAELRAKLEDTR